MKKFFLFLAIIIPIVGVLAGTKITQFKTMFRTMAAAPEPVATVSATGIVEQTWQPSIEVVGTVASVQGVTVSCDTGGKVVDIFFESGGKVEKGDILVQVDSSTEAAQLRAAEASMALARINLERAKTLLEKKTIPVAEYDTAEAQWKQTQAQADTIRTGLAKKQIRAPFSGRLGMRQVNLGQILKTGDPIVSLDALDPVYVNFSLPQQELGRLEKGMKVRITSDAAPDRPLVGEVTAINPDVETGTRNFRVQATFMNPDAILRPGMFVKGAVLLPEKTPVMVIPATAVVFAPFGDSVFVVEDRKDEAAGTGYQVAIQRIVRLGENRGDFVAVNSGVKPGETVVSIGAFKLRNNSRVKVDNTLAPKGSLAPNPSDS